MARKQNEAKTILTCFEVECRPIDSLHADTVMWRGVLAEVDGVMDISYSPTEIWPWKIVIYRSTEKERIVVHGWGSSFKGASYQLEFTDGNGLYFPNGDVFREYVASRILRPRYFSGLG